jgi:lactate dehydrogenase-like 2-hydroxyacid dehydrogenase
MPPQTTARAQAGFNLCTPAGDAQLTPTEIIAHAAGADALLCTATDRMDAATIAALPATLRVLATLSVGTDHIDLAAARARDLPVVNTPDVLSIATAELAMLLVLMAARRAGEGERLVRAGRWTGWAPTQLLGMQVSGKRLGIFGMGRIGRELAAMARGFGMRIHYRNRSRLAPELEAGATHHSTDDSFLAACDILVLMAPGGAGTSNWLNADRLARLAPGSIVVNAARGSLVDDTALIAALTTGHIAAAGLDVYANEPALHPGYLSLENAVLLPHLGSATTETREAMGALALDGITAILTGQTPANRVG